MRPQPGHAVTCGTKLRSPSDWRICWRDEHLLGAVAARRGGQRDADGVADPLLQQDGEPGGGGHDALGPHPRLGEPEVQRIVAARGEPAVHVHQVLDAGDLGGEDDAVVRQPAPLGQRRGAQRALDHRVHRDVAGVPRGRLPGVRVHQLGEQRLVERAPVHADAHGLPVRHRDLDDGAEVLVVPLPADVAGVDAVLGERAGAVGVLARGGGGRCSGSRRRWARRSRAGRAAPRCAGPPRRPRRC